jgi:hypothetical protein
VQTHGVQSRFSDGGIRLISHIAKHAYAVMPAVPPAQRWGTPVYCERCGSVLSTHAGFCQICGAPVSSRGGGSLDAPPPQYTAPPVSQTPPAPRSHTIRNVVIVVVVVLVLLAIPVGLYTIPVPHSFSRTMSGSFFSPGTSMIWPPKGAQVSGSYTSGGCSDICFIITDAYGDLVYDGFGYSGSFSFTATYPPYTLGTETATCSVSGTVSYPTL